MHFDAQWHSLTPHISYGHDIEAQNQTFLHAAFNCWQFAQAQLIDTQYGEWHWSTERLPEKLNIWKTPYHNGRACMEMMERLTPSIIM